MKKIKYRLLLLLGALLILSACEKSEKIDDFPLRPSKLVVNCYFSPDSSWRFQVSKSLSVLDNAELHLVAGAKIMLYQNGTFIDSTSAQDENGWYNITGHQPKEGDEYSLAVTAPKFKAIVQAKDRLPVSVPVDTVGITVTDSAFTSFIEPGGYLHEMGYLSGSFNTTFSDPANVENYYQLSAFYYDTIYNDESHLEYSIQKFNIDITSDDPVIDNDLSGSQGSVFFSDALIDGKTHTIKLDFEDYGAKRTRLYHIQLTSLSKAAYLYRKSIQQYQKSKEDPFSEPVQIYSNIKNGYGIFAGVSISEKTVAL